jgi:hypothetical protein
MFSNFLVSKKNKLALLIICTCFLLNALSAAALATGNGAPGTGTGTGSQKKPLNFVGAYLTTNNGNASATEADITKAQVPPKPIIKITFDKNVIYDAYWPNNEQCVNIFNNSGVRVPTEVSRLSDQGLAESRQVIFISPLQDLNPGEEYKIMISPGLTAKNGVVLGADTNNQPVVIKFTTQSKTTTNTAEQNISNTTGSFAQPEGKSSLSSLIFYIVTGTILVLGCLLLGVRWLLNKK